jgi:hypothetical protein
LKDFTDKIRLPRREVLSGQSRSVRGHGNQDGKGYD